MEWIGLFGLDRIGWNGLESSGMDWSGGEWSEVKVRTTRHGGVSIRYHLQSDWRDKGYLIV